MQPRDLATVRSPSMPAVSPDGRTACYVLTRIDLDADAYRSQLWVVPTDGSAPPRRFTQGDRDVAPAFSPDGRWLAFLRAAEDKPPQLHVMPADGGEPRRVCEHALGVAGIAWAPDSRRIAYVARVPEEGRYGTAKDVTSGKEPARRITTRRYRLDAIGYTIDRRAHVFVIDALAGDEDAVAPSDGEGDDATSSDGGDDAAATRLGRSDGGAPPPLRLTHGDHDHGAPAWSPDGGSIAFSSARHPDRDTNLAADLFVAPAEGGDARQVTAATSTAGDPSFSPDGRWLYFPGHGHDLDIVGRTTGIFRVPVDGSAEPERLTDVESDEISDPLAAGPAGLDVDEERILAVKLDRGAVHLAAFPVEGGEPETLIGGPRAVRGHARGGGTTVAVVASGTSAGEVVRLDGPGEEHVLTSHGEELARTVPLRPMEELTTESSDGYPVHGWIVRPASPGPHPVLLSIHGGPYTQYGHLLFDEAQVYAGAGYAVVLGNPRGSQGYGEAHGRAIIHDMGNLDREDLLALLDAALAEPDLDEARVGVMGGSYGGYMTTLLAATTDRFRAGISERALNAWDSFAGSSDIGAFFVDLYAGTDPERIREQDPLARADDIDIPMLIIHSEEDYRCPLEQAQRLYARLKRNNVETEMLLFPGEGHELSRSGLPSHRVQRFEAILDWWSRHLA
jgi:dipeptidyl aminopeptidase/acylaminoacyl peptidase